MDFVHLLHETIVLLALSTGRRKFMENKKNGEVDYEVIIVGGGMAGITAARHLLTNNVKKILVLEAQNYLGGRIKTIHTEFGHIDLGAEWIHGQVGNPIYKLANDHGLTHNRRQSFYISPSSASIYDVHEFRTEAGNLIDRSIVSEVSKVMEDLYGMQNQNAPKESKDNNDVFVMDDVNMVNGGNLEKYNSLKAVTNSMEKHFSDGFSSFLNNSHNGSIDRETKQSLFRWRIKWELGDNCCSSLEDVAYPGRYLVYDGHGITDLKYGFQSVFSVIKEDVPDHCIQLSNPVTQILWNSNGCSVQSLNGPPLTSNHVIVTIPIGYLQKHYVSLFLPPVPERKIRAIKSVGFSNLLKIFVIWNEPFWDETFSGVQFVWTKPIIQDDIQHKIDQSKSAGRMKGDGNPWYHDITGFERVTGRPNVLCGWVVGDGAVIASSLSDSEVKQACTRLLNLFCNDQNIQEPNLMYRSNWGNNDYICGGYSYVSTRTKDGDFEALCESLPSNENPRVLFAGEATSFNYYSTAHGAYQTGVRAAQQLLNLRESTDM